ncbi:outer membrane lipoprotein-sorting protein [Paraburkholderia fungorum]|uniref:Outer membrane lipoprotein-sorting protein n=1 Tax=Paraburkholderia fungorum TaxID=134537 RepID=A0A1H1JKU7_9BURK|nr:outer membrane lipoprotein-sorting protein [Paraburkholderia fungorum]SDR50572.1 outer membrane lipoprotein-sorting protein [Paraburkholderia fungorum]
MQLLKKTAFLLASLVLASATYAAGSPANSTSTPDATQIVAASDRARGGGLNGVQWTIDITGQDSGGPIDKRTYVVRASGEDSLAEATYPPREAGGRLLQNGRSMWFGKSTLTKPVSISTRQKMVGPASNGDIASTNYAKDYDATLLRIEQVNGENAYVLDLVAKSKFVTYDRIVYYVSMSRLVPLKAEFYTVSGKIFKTASFEMGNRLDIDGAVQPFVSKMSIQDAIDKSNFSLLQYSEVTTKKFGADMFNLGSLNRP